MKEKPRAILKDWRLRHVGDSFVLTGVVKGHPHLPDGEFIHTSTLEAIDFAARTAETLNTIYSLED